MAHQLYDIALLRPYREEGFVFLTPNSRLARRIREEWGDAEQRAGKRVWEPLPVFPLERWLLNRWEHAVRSGALPPLLPLGKIQELQLWQQVIVEDAGETGESGNSVLIDPAGAAELASQARDLILRWQLDVDAPAVRSLFSTEPDCQRMLRWQERFEERLRADQQCTVADCLRQVAALDRPVEPVGVVLLEGGELAPLLEDCLNSQAASAERIVADRGLAALEVHPCSEPRAEYRAVAAWAADRQREAPGETLCIVLNAGATERTALEYQLRRQFDCLGEDYNSLPVNFSTGIPLAEAPAVKTALQLLALIAEETPVVVVAALLQSRFLPFADASSPMAMAFLRRLYDGASERVTPGALRSLASQPDEGEKLLFGQALLALSQRRELHREHLPSEWAAHFVAVLECFGWPGDEALDSLEFQQVTRWYNTLDEFSALDTVCGAMDYKGALQRLRSCCVRQISHPQTADSAVQVLGPLEAAGLSFDHLWILGMQSSTWPAAPAPNPLIPMSLQSQLGMPHATPEREWAFAENLLAQYRRCNAVVHASYSTQVDGVPDSASAMLANAAVVDLPAAPMVDEQWHKRQAANSLELEADSLAPAASEDELSGLRGGAAVLESQSQCPFRAFARHRLRVEPLGEFTVGITPPERGKLVHEALHRLWQQIGDHDALLALSDDQLEDVLAQAVEAGVGGIASFRRIALGPACIELEAARLLALLREWLDVERDRGAFRVDALDSEVAVTLSRLSLRLRVDRIDELPGGDQIIIDYKTGVSRASDWLGERPAKPQLLLYGLAAEQPPAALSFAQVRPGESAYVGLGTVDSIPGVQSDIAGAVKEAMPVDDWESLSRHWRETLQRLAQAFIDGDAAIDPLPGGCDFCGLQSLCRIGLDRVQETGP